MPSILGKWRFQQLKVLVGDWINGLVENVKYLDTEIRKGVWTGRGEGSEELKGPDENKKILRGPRKEIQEEWESRTTEECNKIPQDRKEGRGDNERIYAEIWQK